MTTVDQARRRLLKSLLRSMRESGGFCPKENDWHLNNASCNLVEAMISEHGANVRFGRINLYTQEDKEKPIWSPKEKNQAERWVFGACFVLPKYDAEIERLILERDRSEYTGTKDDFQRVNKIVNRIKDVNGVLLHWS